MAMVVALSSELAQRGHQVDVVCTDRPSGSSHEADWMDLLASRRVAVHFLGRKLGHPGMAAAGKLWWLIQRRQYQVVHSHLPMPDAMSGLARRSSPHRFVHIVTIHNTYEPRSRWLTVFGSGANVVYCSEAARKRNPFPGLSSTVIPNGIPQMAFATPGGSRAEIRNQLGLVFGAKVVIAVGRLCPQKNFATALEALAILKRRCAIPNLQCLLCGTGEDQERLETRVRELELDGIVRLMGARTDIPALLTASDVFLSTSRWEGMPVAVLEALYAGTPCVLSAIEEHFEIAASMPGCRFAPHDPEAMASTLEAILSDAADPQVLRDQRAPLLTKHSIEECAESYHRLYQACCHPQLVSQPARS
jgi:glycosyltransferase involved in cell wall biosynthesis